MLAGIQEPGDPAEAEAMGAAQWEENHGVNVATAGDAAQGTNRKEKAPSSSCSATSTSIKRSEEGSTRRMEYGEGQGNKWI